MHKTLLAGSGRKLDESSFSRYSVSDQKITLDTVSFKLPFTLGMGAAVASLEPSGSTAGRTFQLWAEGSVRMEEILLEHLMWIVGV